MDYCIQCGTIIRISDLNCRGCNLKKSKSMNVNRRKSIKKGSANRRSAKHTVFLKIVIYIISFTIASIVYSILKLILDTPVNLPTFFEGLLFPIAVGVLYWSAKELWRLNKNARHVTIFIAILGIFFSNSIEYIPGFILFGFTFAVLLIDQKTIDLFHRL